MAFPVEIRDRTKIATIQTAVIVDTAAYASGDLIGSKITIADAVRSDGGSGTIRSIVLNCKSSQTTAFDIVFFKADPTGTTFTDNAAIAIAVADFDKIFGGFVFAATTSWIDVGTPSFAQSLVEIPFKLASGTTIFAALISRGTPTFGAVSDVTVTLGIEQY